MKRDVSAQIDLDITDPTVLEFQIAVAPHPGAQVSESLSFRLDGKPIAAKEIIGAHGSRIHQFEAGVGNLQASYEASVVGRTAPAPVDDYDLSMYLRPSRYAEADKFFGFAATEFGQYVGVIGDAAREGVVVGRGAAELRARQQRPDRRRRRHPAGRCGCVPRLRPPRRRAAPRAEGAGPARRRLRAGLRPDGLPRGRRGVRRRPWRVVDATCLAPRSSLVRIATGRDAADTAFLDNYGGAIS